MKRHYQSLYIAAMAVCASDSVGLRQCPAQIDEVKMLRKGILAAVVSAGLALGAGGCHNTGSTAVTSFAHWINCSGLSAVPGCSGGSPTVSVTQRGVVAQVNKYDKTTKQCMVVLKETWPAQKSGVSGEISTSRSGCKKIQPGHHYVIYSSGNIRVR